MKTDKLTKTGFDQWFAYHSRIFPNVKSWASHDIDRIKASWLKSFSSFRATYNGLMTATDRLQLEAPNLYPNKHLSELVAIVQAQNAKQRKAIVIDYEAERREAHTENSRIIGLVNRYRIQIDQLSKPELLEIVGDLKANWYLNEKPGRLAIEMEIAEHLDSKIG